MVMSSRWISIKISEDVRMLFPRGEVHQLWEKYVSKRGVLFENFVNEEVTPFFTEIYRRWTMLNINERSRYAIHIAYLCTDSTRPNVVKAKKNAFCAFLVYRGYVSAYRLIKERVVAGAESVYTWLRLYEQLLGSRKKEKKSSQDRH